jgi:hypothetical protein
LKKLIGEYDEEIIPFAVNLCSKLSETYIDMMKNTDFTNEEEIDPKQLKTALGCVNAIN